MPYGEFQDRLREAVATTLEKYGLPEVIPAETANVKEWEDHRERDGVITHRERDVVITIRREVDLAGAVAGRIWWVAANGYGAIVYPNILSPNPELFLDKTRIPACLSDADGIARKYAGNVLQLLNGHD